MQTADLINGGIYLVVAGLTALFGMGVIPMGKTEDERAANLQKHGKNLCLVAAIMVIMGVFKLFGVMR